MIYKVVLFLVLSLVSLVSFQPEITCSKLKIEAPEQGVKYVKN